jgi:hypothetical protein
MKKKIFIDIIMFIVFIILMFLNFTGILLHEILGISLFLLTLIHIYLNRKFLFGVKLSNPNINNKMKFKFILDWLMTALMITLTITGVLISKYLFTFIYANVSDLHNYLAVIELGLILIHLSLNLNLVYTVLKVKNKIPLIMISILGFVGFYSYIIYHNIFLINKKPEEVEEDIKEEETTVPSQTETAPIETLSEYLSKLRCGGCGRNCSLIAPQCGIGVAKAKKETTAYYEIYGLTQTSNSISYKSGDYEMVIKL